MAVISAVKVPSAWAPARGSFNAYFPRLDFINSHGTPAVLQFLQGCSSITLQRIRRELQTLHAFFARDRTRTVALGVSGFAEDMVFETAGCVAGQDHGRRDTKPS